MILNFSATACLRLRRWMEVGREMETCLLGESPAKKNSHDMVGVESREFPQAQDNLQCELQTGLSHEEIIKKIRIGG
jgi:hypothetical protein